VDARIQGVEVRIAEELATINTTLKQLLGMAESFVHKDKFQTIQMLVYGFAAIILTSVLGALVAKVVIK
jgi:hypothetical protein